MSLRSSLPALCVIFFLLLALFAVGSIVLPAIDWVALIPERIPKVRAALDPVLDLYKAFDNFVERILSQVTFAPEQGGRLGSKLRTRCPAFLRPRRRTCSSSSSSLCW